MAKILLRAAKGPLDVVSPETTLRRNTVATNSGNLLFSHAAHKILLTEGTEIHPNRNRRDPADAEEINERYDAFVVPLANAFRPEFESFLQSLTELIERLRIPVVVFGVGAQADLDYDPTPLQPMASTVKRFASAVLDRSATIGVRGEFTAEYLRGLGINDVEVIGCPSMFLHGQDLAVHKKVPHLTRESAISLNVSPYAALKHEVLTPYLERMSRVLMNHYHRYPNLTYIGQDTKDLTTLLWGDAPEDRGKTSDLPLYTSHPLFKQNRVRYFADPWTWIWYLRDVDFTFGTRIHGNMAALLAGTPCFVLAHDSRTLEMAQYFEIPYRKITDVPPDVDAARLYDEADFTGMHANHHARLTAMTDFLDRNGLDHIFNHDQKTPQFDVEVAGTSFPPAVETLNSPEHQEIIARLWWLRETTTDLDRQLAAMKRKVDGLERVTTRVRTLERSTEKIAQLSARVEALERAAEGRPYRRTRRVAGRVRRRIRGALNRR